MRDPREILENLSIDVEELTDTLRYEVQHSTNFAMNPTAFSKPNDTGEWIMSCCPNHAESKPSFGISKEPPYACNCFLCGYLGTVDQVIELALGLDDGEGIKMLLSSFVLEEKRVPIDIEALIANGRERLRIPGLDEQVLQSFRTSRDQNPWLFDSAMAYLKNERGLNDRTISTYEIGVDIKNNCVVFPQRTRTGELRFLQKRKLGDYRGAKFINDGHPIKKDILFGLHHINKLRATPHRIKRVRVVESPIDAMSNYQVGYPAVALNGRILFRNQIQALQLAGVEVVDLMLDNDKAGQDGQKDAAYWLDRSGFIVNQVQYPNAICKDSNDLLRAGMLHMCPVVSANFVRGLCY